MQRKEGERGLEALVRHAKEKEVSKNTCFCKRPIHGGGKERERRLRNPKKGTKKTSLAQKGEGEKKKKRYFYLKTKGRKEKGGGEERKFRLDENGRKEGPAGKGGEKSRGGIFLEKKKQTTKKKEGGGSNKGGKRRRLLLRGEGKKKGVLTLGKKESTRTKKWYFQEKGKRSSRRGRGNPSLRRIKGRKSPIYNRREERKKTT